MEQLQKHGKKRTSAKRRKKKIIVSLAMIFSLIVLLVILAFAFVWNKYEKMEKIELVDTKINELPEETEEVLTKYKTFAVFGLDNRSNGNFKSGNSDVIMVVSLNEDTGEIKMASIYRDTYLDIGKGKFRKANAAYAVGGPQQAVNMLNKNLDLNITEYVAVDFNAVVDGVDMLGGIELDIAPEEVKHMNVYIDGISEVTGKKGRRVKSGMQLCDGVQATAYTRIRATIGWDFKRTERQRTVITKMFEKAKKEDIFTLNNMLDEILDEVCTNIEPVEMVNLISSIGTYHMGENTGFPIENMNMNIGEMGDLVVPTDLESNVRQLHEFLYSNEKYEPSETVKALSDTIKSKAGE